MKIFDVNKIIDERFVKYYYQIQETLDIYFVYKKVAVVLRLLCLPVFALRKFFERFLMFILYANILKHVLADTKNNRNNI